MLSFVSAHIIHITQRVFAAVDFTRSALACGAAMFSRPLYINLGNGSDCISLAELTVGCLVESMHYTIIVRHREKGLNLLPGGKFIWS